MATSSFRSFSWFRWKKFLLCSCHRFLYCESEALNCTPASRLCFHPSLHSSTWCHLPDTALGSGETTVGHDESDSCSHKAHSPMGKQLQERVKQDVMRKLNDTIWAHYRGSRTFAGQRKGHGHTECLRCPPEDELELSRPSAHVWGFGIQRASWHI